MDMQYVQRHENRKLLTRENQNVMQRNKLARHSSYKKKSHLMVLEPKEGYIYGKNTIAMKTGTTHAPAKV